MKIYLNRTNVLYTPKEIGAIAAPSSSQNNQVLWYTDSSWVNHTLTATEVGAIPSPNVAEITSSTNILLEYDRNTSAWIPNQKTAEDFGAIPVPDSPSDGMLLAYESSQDAWLPKDSNNLFITAGETTGFLKREGTVWKPGTVSITDLTGIDLGDTISDKSIMMYQGTEWKPFKINKPNENLLINPWFQINQRGINVSADSSEHGWVTLSTSSRTYFLDMWYTGAAASPSSQIVALDQDSEGNIVVYLDQGQSIYQDVEDLDGKTNIKEDKDSGLSIICSCLSSTTISGDYTLNENIEMKYENGKFTLTNTSSSVGIYIKCAKLEVGYYETLTYDMRPDASKELLKCQRYYYILNSSPDPSPAYSATTSGINIGMTLGTALATIPKISCASDAIQVILSNATTLITAKTVSNINANSLRGDIVNIRIVPSTSVSSRQVGIARVQNTVVFDASQFILE